jgi:Luciferase-like monooxygenase
MNAWPRRHRRLGMNTRLRFGIFLAPFHPPGENPTLALQRDLELIQHLDRLGYDEAWIGEHHSAGTEIIASPEIFIAVAAERTAHIRLGTGVVSLSYHNPLWVAERIVLLDHLTRGRVMLGVGPGSLPTDAAMIGVSQAETRELMEQSLDVIMALLRTEEPVTFKNSRGTCVTRGCIFVRIRTRCSTSRSPRSPRRAVHGWPANTASACCPSARPRRPASTRSPCIGT